MGILNTVLDIDQQCFDFYKQDCMVSGSDFDMASRAITITAGAADTVLTSTDAISIDWSKLNSSISLGSLHSDTITSPMQAAPSGRLTLTGDNADIEINGESVVGVLREIRDRLGILKVSDAMEAEWDELRQLREQYQAKLAECEEKSRAWAALQQMPPPQMP